MTWVIYLYIWTITMAWVIYLNIWIITMTLVINVYIWIISNAKPSRHFMLNLYWFKVEDQYWFYLEFTPENGNRLYQRMWMLNSTLFSNLESWYVFQLSFSFTSQYWINLDVRNEIKTSFFLGLSTLNHIKPYSCIRLHILVFNLLVESTLTIYIESTLSRGLNSRLHSI